MYSETFLFKSEDGYEVIVNDGSEFTRSIFEGANKILSSYYKMETHPSAIVCPADYEEDAFQKEQRTYFHLSQWLLVALEVGEDFEPRQALLMNKYRQEEGFVFDFILEKVIVTFFRFFSIQETPTSAILSQKDFLESINLSVEQRKEAEYQEFEDDEDEYYENYFDYNPLPKPTFEAVRKDYEIPNFGGSETVEEETDEDEELEELHIEVARPTFVAGGKKKPANLNAIDQDKEYQKKKAREKKLEEEEQEDLHIEVSKPAFQAGGKKKPTNLDAIDQDKRYQKKKAQEKKLSEEKEEQTPELHIELPKTTFVPNNNNKPINLSAHDKVEPREKEKVPQKKPEEEIEHLHIEVVKPVFAPSNNKKPEVIDDPHEKKDPQPPKMVVRSVSEPHPEQQILTSDGQDKVATVVIEEEKKVQTRPIVSSPREGVSAFDVPLNNYKAEASFNIRPDVWHGEISLINNPSDKYSSATCSLLYERLKEIKTLRISTNCLFVPEILDNGHEIFSLAENFSAEEWTLLVLIHDKEEKPLYTVLGNKKDENLAILVSFRHRYPRIMVISTKGISLNDPAYPFYNYRNLLSLVKGETPYK